MTEERVLELYSVIGVIRNLESAEMYLKRGERDVCIHIKTNTNEGQDARIREDVLKFLESEIASLREVVKNG